MPTLISRGGIVSNDWTQIETVTDDHIAARSIIPAEYALSHPDSIGTSANVGIWIEGDSEPDALAPLLDRLPLIAVRFSTVNDGRGLSIAVLLRTRLGYTGELRAIGEVHEDVLHYMHRCGFDTYELPDGHDPTVALAAMNSYSGYYQGSVVDPRPAFRRVDRGRTSTPTV